MPVDILLVNPVFFNQDEAERELMTPYFPLGLLYLAAFLREKGMGVEIFDGTFAQGVENFSAALEEHRPRVVGISSVQPNRQMAFRLARLAKRFEAQVVLGGPDPTAVPEVYLAEPAVDFVVHHEGEITLFELLKALLNEGSLDLKEIDGIGYRDEKGDTIVKARRAYILDLDDLPLPARDLVNMDQYLTFWRENYGYSSLTISLARGCPYGCEWCEQSIHGAEFRQRSPDNVVKEIKSLMQSFEIDRLRVVDDVDGIDREWIESWAEIAEAEEAVLPFEALNDLKRADIPMLDVRAPL